MIESERHGLKGGLNLVPLQLCRDSSVQAQCRNQFKQDRSFSSASSVSNLFQNDRQLLKLSHLA